MVHVSKFQMTYSDKYLTQCNRHYQESKTGVQWAPQKGPLSYDILAKKMLAGFAPKVNLRNSPDAVDRASK